MTDVANLGLAVDSSDLVTATGNLERMNQEAAKSPDRISRLSQASDSLVAALNRNSGATEALTRRMAEMDAANDRAAASLGRVGTQAQVAGTNVTQFNATAGQTTTQLGNMTRAADLNAASWKRLGNDANEALRKITAARAAALAPPPPVTAPVAPPPGGGGGGYQTSMPWGMPARVGPTGPAIPQGGGGGSPSAPNGRMSPQQLQNLFYQGSDVAVTAAMGMNPLMIAMQQGPQIAQSFMGPGSGTLRGLASQGAEALGNLAARIGVMGAAAGTAAAAVVTLAAAQMSYSSGQAALAQQLRGAGRASGVSVADVNALANAGGGGLSIGQRREFAGQLAGTGRIGNEMLAPILGSLRDYRATTGMDRDEAMQSLTAAFADPVKGAEALDRQLGFLNSTTQENIQRLTAQGDRLGAQRSLFEAYNNSVRNASANMSSWGRVSETVLTTIGSYWDKLGQQVDKVVSGGSLDQQIKDLEAVLKDAPAQAPGGILGFLGVGANIAPLRAELERLRARRNLDVGDRGESALRVTVKASDDALKSLNSAKNVMDDMEDKAKLIAKPFTDAGLDPFGPAKTAIDAIAVAVRQIKEDMAAGGAAFADSIRAAQFQVKSATFTPESMSVAQIDEQAANKRIAAMRSAAENPNFAEAEANYQTQLRAIEEERRLLQQAQQARVVNQGANGGGRYRITLAQVPTQYRDAVYQSAIQNNLNPDMLASQIYTESRFNPNAVSRVGAQGIAQFMPDTARGMGLANPFDPMASIAAMGRHMRQLMDQYGNDETSALVGYNAGVRTRNRFQASGRDVAVLPDETRNYVRTIQTPEPTAGERIREADARTRALRLEQDQLKATQQAGGENTAQLRAQHEALKAISDAQAQNVNVSKELEAQLTAEARARENVRLAGQYSAFVANDNFARAQLGRDRTDQQAYAAARTFAGSDFYDQAVGRARETIELTEAKQMVTDGATSFVSALRRGATASEALANAFGSAADKLLNKAIDSLVSSAFGGGSSGGLFDFLKSGSDFMKFDRGGYTGSGGRLEPAGIVHRGEVVWSQSDVARYGGAAIVERMRLGYPGYADGGTVGQAKQALGAMGNDNRMYAPISVSVQGSSGDPATDRAYIEQMGAQLRSEMAAVYKEQESRSLQTNGALWKAGVRRAA